MKRLTVAVLGLSAFAVAPPAAGQAAPRPLRAPTARSAEVYGPQPGATVVGSPSPEAPAPWLQQDQADSLYRLARSALSAGNYRTAARHFRSLRDRYPRSGYVADSYYWEAFALSKTGSGDRLKQAVGLLDLQAERHPDARTRRDAGELRARIRGQLAQQGDAEAAEEIAGIAAELAPPSPPRRGVVRVRPPRPPRAPRAIGPFRGRRSECDSEDDERLVALSALMQMRSEQAVPILKRVLERRDEGSVCLRRKAVFLVSQKRSAETARILLQSARSDPDPEVREQAVFWLSQVNTPEATAALDSILQHATDRNLQEKAVFALSQQRSEAASRALRDHLERTTTPDDIKENIIFWLGQRRSEENAQYLREFYARTTSPELKKKVIFSLSQMNLEENARWIMAIALDESASVEVRKNALFWAGQMRAVDIEDLTSLYDRMTDPEMREHLIFIYSQRRESAAVDKLMDIARNGTSRELRGKAIFWLGQSNDPRVIEFLMEIINR
ncbi:MAG: HEAT repeat domain-containing protein [Gemmatimonadales bacterium]